MKRSQKIPELFSGHDFCTEIDKEYIDGLTVLVLCTLTDDALYLYQVPQNYLKSGSELLS